MRFIAFFFGLCADPAYASKQSDLLIKEYYLLLCQEVTKKRRISTTLLSCSGAIDFKFSLCFLILPATDFLSIGHGGFVHSA